MAGGGRRGGDGARPWGTRGGEGERGETGEGIGVRSLDRTWEGRAGRGGGRAVRGTGRGAGRGTGQARGAGGVSRAWDVGEEGFVVLIVLVGLILFPGE